MAPASATDIAADRIYRYPLAGVGSRNDPAAGCDGLGPTGVGKTELARALAEFLFDDEQSMVRTDVKGTRGGAAG